MMECDSDPDWEASELESELESEEFSRFVKPYATGKKTLQDSSNGRGPRTTYPGLMYSDHHFKVGDAVILSWVERSREKEKIVQIKEIYVEKGDVFIWAMYYYTKKDFRRHRKKFKLRNRELVASDNYDAFLASTIEHTAIIYSTEEDMKHAEQDNEKSRYVFFCDTFTNRKKKDRWPLDSAAGGGNKSIADEAPWIKAYATAMNYLQLSYVPGVLPCRQQQRDQIKTFLDKAIRSGGTGGGLYISGMPGTGKTASVHQVVRELKSEGLDFRYIEVNMMKLPTPKHVYSEIYRQWGKRGGLKQRKNPSPALAARLLEQMFTNKSKQQNHTVSVLLVDELDYLITRNEQVIYNLFHWPSQKHARLAVVGIANTMNLIEQFSPRVQSRVGLQRVQFAPYNKANIAEICQSRIQECEVFDRDAINFCATKVASVSGDIRRALQILRRAARIVQEEIKKDPQSKMRLVGMREIKAAVKDLFDSSDMLILSNMGLVPSYLLVTLVHYLNMNRCTSCPLCEVHRRANQFLSMKGHPEFSLDEIEDVIDSLALQRVILKEYNPAEFKRDIRLNVKVEYVVDAFQSHTELSTILATIRGAC